MARDERLTARLGLPEALALGIGSMIGAGIFVLSGLAARNAGPAASFSYLFAGGAVLLTALSFAELSSALPRAGGPYAFVQEAFGPTAAFLTGWSLWIGLSIGTAFYCTGFGYYLTYLLPGVKPLAGALGAFLLVVAANAAGTRETGRLQTSTTFVLLLILGIYVAGGLGRLDRTLHDPFLPYGWGPVLATIPMIFISYLGFELITAASEEIRNPQVNLPLATLGSVLIVTLIYSLVVYVATGLRSHVDLGQTPTPIADTAEVFLGRRGALLVAVGGLLATISSANGSVLAASRIAYAMSRNGLLPGGFGRLRGEVPTKALTATAAIGLVALLLGRADWLARATGLLHLSPFLLANLAVIQLRARGDLRPAFRIPFGPLVPLLGGASTAAMLVQARLGDLAAAGALVLPGMVLYAWRTAGAAAIGLARRPR